MDKNDSPKKKSRDVKGGIAPSKGCGCNKTIAITKVVETKKTLNNRKLFL